MYVTKTVNYMLWI